MVSAAASRKRRAAIDRVSRTARVGSTAHQWEARRRAHGDHTARRFARAPHRCNHDTRRIAIGWIRCSPRQRSGRFCRPQWRVGRFVWADGSRAVENHWQCLHCSTVVWIAIWCTIVSKRKTLQLRINHSHALQAIEPLEFSQTFCSAYWFLRSICHPLFVEPPHARC
jgi:hypothetical protein